MSRPRGGACRPVQSDAVFKESIAQRVPGNFVRRWFARKLRRYADVIESADVRQARAKRVPTSLYRLAQRLNKVAPIRTVIDVGAHNGEFAKLSAVCFPGAAIHCFEPLPICQPALAALARQDPRVTIHPFALGEVEGDIAMHQCDFESSSSLLQMQDGLRSLLPAGTRSTLVQAEVRRLDSFQSIVEGPAFLKLDVQGYELHVLRGARRALESIAAIQAEIIFEPFYEGQADFRSLINMLADAGFRFVEFLHVHRNAEGRLLYADGAFIAERILSSEYGEAGRRLAS
jgi:FkbM family methyltransferase